MTKSEIEEATNKMSHAGISYYGGSALEAKLGRESYEAQERAIKNGYSIRREPGKIIIVIKGTRESK